MSYTVLQSNHNNSTTAVATPGAVSAGSLLVLGINVGDGAAITSVTDGLNTWTQIGTDIHDAVNGQLYSLWNAQNVFASAGAVTATLHAGGAIAAQSLVIAEIAGIATSSPLRVQDTTKDPGTTSATANAQTSNPIYATALDFYLALICISNSPQTYTAGAGFTQIVSESGNPGATGGCALEWKNAAGGSELATYTTNTAGQPYSMLVAAFMPAYVPPTTQVMPMSVSSALRN